MISAAIGHAGAVAATAIIVAVMLARTRVRVESKTDPRTRSASRSSGSALSKHWTQPFRVRLWNAPCTRDSQMMNTARALRRRMTTPQDEGGSAALPVLQVR